MEEMQHHIRCGPQRPLGDLDGDGIVDMLIAQNIPRVPPNAFDQIIVSRSHARGQNSLAIERPDPQQRIADHDTRSKFTDIDGDGHKKSCRPDFNCRF